MKFLKRFNEMVNDIDSGLPTDSVYSDPHLDQPKKDLYPHIIYKPEWEAELPELMSINYHGKVYKFKKGNIMLVADMVQITYDSYPGEIWGVPDTLEFDVYFAKDDNTKKMRIDVDITYGDLMACEFSIEEPNKVNIIQHTTYHSKFDPSNTVFALEDESLDKFINFLNKFNGLKLTRYDLRFLDKYDNWSE